MAIPALEVLRVGIWGRAALLLVCLFACRGRVVCDSAKARARRHMGRRWERKVVFLVSLVSLVYSVVRSNREAEI